MTKPSAKQAPKGKPKFKGRPKPKFKGRPKPKFKGRPKPKSKGRPKPKSKGRPKPKSKGRPTKYTPAIARKILARLADGHGLKTICRDDTKLPPATTIRGWYIDDRPKGFYVRYAHARELGAHAMADEINEIADDGRQDYAIFKTASGKTIIRFDQERVQRSRLRIDARKWLTSKILPKIFGDKIDLDGQLEIKMVIDADDAATISKNYKAD